METKNWRGAHSPSTSPLLSPRVFIIFSFSKSRNIVIAFFYFLKWILLSLHLYSWKSFNIVFFRPFQETFFKGNETGNETKWTQKRMRERERGWYFLLDLSNHQEYSNLGKIIKSNKKENLQTRRKRWEYTRKRGHTRVDEKERERYKQKRNTGKGSSKEEIKHFSSQI